MNRVDSAEKRDEIDPVFKEVMSFRFRQLGLPLQTEVEVSRRPRTIDALIRLERGSDLQRARTETPFAHFQWHNQVEFKGKHDTLTMAAYHLILGRAFLYIGESELLPTHMTVSVVCSRKPRKLLSQVEFRHVAEGYYTTDIGLPVYLMVVNELPVIPKNYPLLLFTSSRRKFRRFLQRMIEAENFDYISFAYHLHPQLTREVLTMAGRHRIPKKDLEFMAKDIGPELVQFLSPEERLRGLDAEERLRGLDAQERLRGLDAEERLRGLDAQERLRGLDAEERLRGLDAQERLRGLDPDEIPGLTPGERELMRQLLRRLEHNGRSR